MSETEALGAAREPGVSDEPGEAEEMEAEDQ